jgi:hypothetical protein
MCLLLSGSVIYAKYISRQSPVLSPALLSLRSMPCYHFPQATDHLIWSTSPAVDACLDRRLYDGMHLRAFSLNSLFPYSYIYVSHLAVALGAC